MIKQWETISFDDDNNGDYYTINIGIDINNDDNEVISMIIIIMTRCNK